MRSRHLHTDYSYHLITTFRPLCHLVLVDAGNLQETDESWRVQRPKRCDKDED